MSLFALRWILDHPQVSSIIAGVSRPDQIGVNAEAGDLPELPGSVHEKLAAFYADKVRPAIRGEI